MDENFTSIDSKSPVEVPAPPELGAQVAEALTAVGKIAGRRWKGEEPTPEDERQLRAAIEPIVAAGFTAAGRMLQKHQPTREQRRAARKATLAVARQAKERAAAAFRPE